MNSQSERPSSTGHVRHASIAAATGCVLFACFVVWLLPAHVTYIPITDDLALLGASAPLRHELQIESWVTNGFREYFSPFPEWNGVKTPFVRPVVNSLFWAYSTLFGQQWAWYFLAGYLAMSVAAGLLVFQVPTATPSPRLCLFAAFVGTVIACHPATLYTHESPSFSIDGLVALFLLIALLLLEHHRTLPAVAVLIVAVFTKETAIVFCLAACAWLAAHRRWRDVVYCAVPIAAWVLVLLSFTGFERNYVVPASWSQAAVNLLTFARLWPLGLGDEGLSLRVLVNTLFLGDPTAQDGYQAALVATNAVIAFVVAAPALRALWERRFQHYLASTGMAWHIAVAVFICLAFFRLDARFGAPLVLLSLRIAAERLDYTPTRTLIAAAAPLVVLLLLSADAHAERMRPHPEGATHASAEILRAIADEPAARVVVVNMPSRVAANPALVARAVGFRGELTFATVTSMCIDAQSSPPLFRRTPTEVVIELELPICAPAYWPREVRTQGLESEKAQRIHRGARWTYHASLPENVVQSHRIVIRDSEPASMYLWVDYRTGNVEKLRLIDVERHP